MKLQRVSLFLASLALFACKGPSEEDRIKKVIESAVAAANEMKAKEVVENALPSFKGPGGKPPDDCRRILAVYFVSAGWTHVFTRGLEITVDGDKAKAKLDTVIAQGKPVEKLEDLVPTNGDAITFELELEKVDGDWKFAAASYKRGH
jgi:hypothetical protein